MNAIQLFCERRMISKSLESAFTSYCKTNYAQRFDMKEGDTIQRIVSNMNEEQVEEAWLGFVSELGALLH